MNSPSKSGGDKRGAQFDSAELEHVAGAIFLAAAYPCHSTVEASSRLAGDEPGYAYRRDGHPNADALSASLAKWHGAERCAITSSGMSALALALVSQCQQGDHLVISSQLYGRSLQLLGPEAQRLGISCTAVDVGDLAAVEAALRDNTRLVVVESISNPLLAVADIAGLAELSHRRGALLLVDNTIATPYVCRPLEWGADLVLESVSKAIAGHGDVILGALLGGEAVWSRVMNCLSAWGLTSSSLDCYLALRGLETLAVRQQQACATAEKIAQLLSRTTSVERVFYPSLSDESAREMIDRQFGRRYGSLVSFTLRGGLAAAERFIATGTIPFLPTLGDACTTLTHPASTSHRGMTEPARRALGIDQGTIRLSVGVEPEEDVLLRLEQAFLSARAG